jgi:ubiquinone/menaquinone biosynthesis C-methylase UbiE
MTAYDSVPYPSTPLVQTHPDRLATIAVLAGLEPAPAKRCRLLEIGCATGGNLLPMAAELPESRFVGVDSSGEALAEARSLCAALGLQNVEFVESDVRAFAASEAFDYVVCHGMFSWIPAEAQEAFLALCQRSLAPQGVAYVNYNTQPGWQMRLALRDLLRRHVATFEDPRAQLAEARALLADLKHGLEPTPFGQLAGQVLEELGQTGDAYLFHEYLRGENHPLHLHEFVSLARTAGLSYLGEAAFEDTSQSLFPERIHAGLTRTSDEFLTQAQRSDFLEQRSFRTSLLCLPAALPDGPPELLLGDYQAASRIGERLSDRPLSSTIPEPYEFMTEGSRRVTIPDPLTRAAVVVLGERWPSSLSLAELLGAASAKLEEEGGLSGDASLARLQSGLLELFAKGVLRLSRRRAPVANEVSERPLAALAARTQAQSGPLVANALHQAVGLDVFERVLLPALDGTRGREELIEHLVVATLEGLLAVEVDGEPLADPQALADVYQEALSGWLASFAQRGLLVDHA